MADAPVEVACPDVCAGIFNSQSLKIFASVKARMKKSLIEAIGQR
jgi:hypothetical protein